MDVWVTKRTAVQANHDSAMNKSLQVRIQHRAHFRGPYRPLRRIMLQNLVNGVSW